VDVFESRDGMAGDSDENVPDDNASFVGRALGLDFENDSGGFFCALEGLAESVGETHRLQAYAEITLRDVTFFQQGVDRAVDCGRGNGDGAEASETRSDEANDAALRIDDGTADGSGLQADVEANVGCEGRASPGTSFGGDEADDAERGDGAAGAGAADD
jgi:hypothetical protein